MIVEQLAGDYKRSDVEGEALLHSLEISQRPSALLHRKVLQQS